MLTSLQTLIFLFFLLKGSPNETPQNVIQIFPPAVLCDRLPDPRQECPERPDEGRDPPVSDALLPSAPGLSLANPDEKR